MYITDFREEALVHVIESLDTQLFERVTGIILDDFHRLAEIGVFNPARMNEAIWQFRLFERLSLAYLGDDLAAPGAKRVEPERIGPWNRTMDPAALSVG